MTNTDGGEAHRGMELELEQRIRGLILSSEASGPVRSHPGREMSGLPPPETRSIPGDQSHGKSFIGNKSSDAVHEKPTKRRLNQAQRRQMSSQLSIPVGPEQYQQQASHTNTHWNQTRPYSSTVEAGQAARERQTQPSYSALPTGFHGAAADGSQFANTGRHFPQGSITHLYRPAERPFLPQTTADEPFRHHDPNRKQFLMPRSRPTIRLEDAMSQSNLLDRLCHEVVRNSEIDRTEIAEKEGFRQKIEILCQKAIYEYETGSNSAQPFPAPSVRLKCFGSLSSGFATKASDMDLGLFSPLSKVQPDAAESPIPRLLEKVFLEAGYGARLLSRTRVPIIKLCEHPPEHLRQALLTERSKWEDGGDSVSNDRPEDGPNDQQDQAEKLILQDNPDTEEELAEPLSPYEFEVPSRNAHDKVKRLHLRQGSRTSLSSYYIMAKRVLRKAGGRDVTWSNHRDFNALDWSILNQVCAGFVRGLYDAELRTRVELIPSLAFPEKSKPDVRRSLSGVYTQVDGEEMLLNWSRSVLKAYAKEPTPQDDQIMLTWQDVQHRADFGVDPLLYNKDLQISFDKLSALPPMKLARLAQGQQESPSQYYTRTMQLHAALFGGRKVEYAEPCVQEINSRYLLGVHGEDLRAELQTFLDGSPEALSLQELAQKHKCLHLAQALSKMLDNGQCEKEVLSDIRKYITLLRSPLQKVQSQRHGLAVIIPLLEDTLPLLSTVRQLSDPRITRLSRAADKINDKLEFPATGAGVQCDINFSAHLALQNSLLLRCYSLTDPRVRPFVLFIKRWAKVRSINSGYRGTLSSYGYVLMVLHYLVNVASPFVCPNLQQLAPAQRPNPSTNDDLSTSSVNGYNVQFWRNEAEISHLASTNQLNRNEDTIGKLLWGFFEYFAHNGTLSRGYGRGFDWGREVLSLRSPGGLLTKQAKGWTGARTVIEGDSISGRQPGLRDQRHDLTPAMAQAAQPGADQTNQNGRQASGGHVKEVRHRYLFAIEDPFELEHNVARTVTHKGIVSIRDEFRRAWRIIRSSGRGGWQENLLEDCGKTENEPESFWGLLNDIHGL